MVVLYLALIRNFEVGFWCKSFDFGNCETSDPIPNPKSKVFSCVSRRYEWVSSRIACADFLRDIEINAEHRNRSRVSHISTVCQSCGSEIEEWKRTSQSKRSNHEFNSFEPVPLGRFSISHTQPERWCDNRLTISGRPQDSNLLYTFFALLREHTRITYLES